MGLIQSTYGVIGGASSLTLTLTGVSSSNALILLLAADVAMTGTPSGFAIANAPAGYLANSTSAIAQIYTNLSPSAGSNSAVMNWSGSDYAVAVLLEWKGMTASPLDATPAANNTTGTSSGGSNSGLASGTLAQASEVVFVVIAENSSGAGSTNIGITDPPSGFTLLSGANQNSTVTVGAQFAYQIVSSTSSVSAAWTWVDTANWISQATMASFKMTPVVIAWTT